MEIQLKNKKSNNSNENKIQLEADKLCNEKYLKKLTKDKEDLEKNNLILKNKIDDIIKELSNKNKEYENKKRSIDEFAKRSTNQTITSEEVLKMNSIFDKESSEKRNDKQKLFEKLNRQNIEINDIKDKISDKKEEVNAISINIENGDKILKQYKEDIKKLEEEKIILIKEIKQLKDDQKKYEKEVNNDEKEYNNVIQQINQIKEKIDISKHEQSVNKAYTSLLSKYKDDIIGRFKDLCQPINSKYDTCLITAFGKFMDAIVVKKQSECDNYIKLLREEQIFPMIFIPLDSIKEKRINEDYRNLGDKYKLAIDCVKYQKDFMDKVCQFVLQDTIICDTLEDGVNLVFKEKKNVKVVSLEGDVIAKNKSITGGIQSLRNVSWRESQLIDLNEKSKELNDKISEYKRKLNKNNNNSIYKSIETKQDKIKNIEIKNKEYNEKINLIEERKKGKTEEKISINKELRELEKKLKELEIKNKDINENIKKIDIEIKKIREEIFSQLSQENNNIDDYLSIYNEIIQRQPEITQLDKEINELTNNKEKYESEIKNNNERIKSINNEKETKNELLEKLNKDIVSNVNKGESEENIKIKIDEINKKIDEKIKLINENKDKIRKLEKEIEELTTDLSKSENQIDYFKKQRHDLILQILQNNINLPKLDNEENSNNYSENYSQSTQTTDYEDSDNIYIGGIDFNNIKHQQNHIDEITFNKICKEYDDKLNRINDQIRQINPNLKADESHKEITEKIENINKELNEITDKRGELEKDLDELGDKRRELLKNLIDIVKNSIDSIYKELTKNVLNSGGGSAYITELNESDPWKDGIIYSVTPPNKTNKEIATLSGGEKTLASLALLFAIYKYKSSPFLIMDEIDAQLDIENINKVVNYINSNKNDIQFIVISLKDSLYSKADGIVGIYKRETSEILTLDLENYN